VGALAVTRLEYGWVIAALLVAAGAATVARPGAGYGRLVAVCSVAALACLPWLAYTYALTGRSFYWGNAGSLSLYWMSAPTPDQLGQWHSWRHTLTQPALGAYRPVFERPPRWIRCTVISPCGTSRGYRPAGGVGRLDLPDREPVLLELDEVEPAVSSPGAGISGISV